MTILPSLVFLLGCTVLGLAVKSGLVFLGRAIVASAQAYVHAYREVRKK